MHKLRDGHIREFSCCNGGNTSHMYENKIRLVDIMEESVRLSFDSTCLMKQEGRISDMRGGGNARCQL